MVLSVILYFLIIIFLLVLLEGSGAAAFTIFPSSPKYYSSSRPTVEPSSLSLSGHQFFTRYHVPAVTIYKRKSSQFTNLNLSKGDDDDHDDDVVVEPTRGNNNITATDTTSGVEPSESETPDSVKKFQLPQSFRDGWNVISMTWAYTTIFLGVALSCGLVLNLMGYGYTVSSQDGLRIDSLDQLRKEQVFRKEAIRLEKETISSSKKHFLEDSSSPDNQSQPPTATLPR